MQFTIYLLCKHPPNHTPWTAVWFRPNSPKAPKSRTVLPGNI